ncbi:MAG: flavodoxin domain-containing protein [Thermodesulfobacteriota bacterium]
MANILIVYASDYGSTRKMAEALAAGVQSAGGAATLKEAGAATLDDLAAADGLALGSPVHMGSMDWRVKQFIDTVCSAAWMKDLAVGKAGAVFASGSGFGNAGGGAELTLLGMLNNLAELGLVLLPLPKNTPGYAKAGLQWGPYGRAHHEDLSPKGLDDAQLEAARAHGANLARLAGLLKNNTVFA